MLIGWFCSWCLCHPKGNWLRDSARFSRFCHQVAPSARCRSFCRWSVFFFSPRILPVHLSICLRNKSKKVSCPLQNGNFPVIVIHSWSLLSRPHVLTSSLKEDVADLTWGCPLFITRAARLVVLIFYFLKSPKFSPKVREIPWREWERSTQRTRFGVY